MALKRDDRGDARKTHACPECGWRYAPRVGVRLAGLVPTHFRPAREAARPVRCAGSGRPDGPPAAKG